MNIITNKIERLCALLYAIKTAFLYAIINSIISIILTALYMTTYIKIPFKPEFINLITFIVSLLITSRTNNAYNRYLEGQSLWTKIRITVLDLAGFIRIHINNKEQKEYYTSILFISSSQPKITFELIKLTTLGLRLIQKKLLKLAKLALRLM
ncbi:hypothetical protein F8M41_017918 [Gigaspora margarita]|uniref:Uncharacterized protein n=1 Tax=Gigaspora margarita TaxID=4874 RepID=A0A8H4EUA9_GIGMA|nr:hypothetical protein F8M41_017918 [Gigaspora margarita]